MADQTRTQKNYDKLWANTDTDENAYQLIYPTDFGQSVDHPGLGVVFEFNKLIGSQNRPYENSLGTGVQSNLNTTKRVNSSGDTVDNTETSMQRDGGRLSIRTTLAELNNTIGYQKTQMSVVLPPPDQWTTHDSFGWNNASLPITGAILANTSNSRAIIDKLKSGEFAAASGEAAKDLPSIVTSAGLAAAETKIPAIRDWTALVGGLSEANFNEVMFDHVQNRTFPFTWTFVARNDKEAKVINAIIHRFRWASHPELWNPTGQNSSFYKAPWTFDISFVDLNTGVENPRWPKIGTCACTGITVNRTPRGEMALVGDEKQPLAITLEMQFTELFVLNKDHLENSTATGERRASY